MTATTIAMYGLSTTHIALSLKQNLIAFFEQDAASGRLTILNDPGNRLVYSQIAIETINVSLCAFFRYLSTNKTIRPVLGG